MEKGNKEEIEKILIELTNKTGFDDNNEIHIDAYKKALGQIQELIKDTIKGLIKLY